MKINECKLCYENLKLYFELGLELQKYNRLLE